ncbi:hypothetical protein DFP95_10372 [Cohnella lupini]|uniref:Uncharacterized protein n=1 Tax=Cohnella lupini TaxID=1294267 RepID=A0A3D9IPY4_9BACL|nr:hypothetical protein DFP95_10372 [Cohnella lupini]
MAVHCRQASRLTIFIHNPPVNRINEYYGYADNYSLILENVSNRQRVIREILLENYSRKEIRELSNYIVPEWDYLFNYVGNKALPGYNRRLYQASYTA